MPGPVDEEFLVVFVLIRLDNYLAIVCEEALFVALNSFQQTVDLANGASQGQGQRVSGTFQPLQEIGAHHGDQKVLPVRLVEIPGFLLIRQLLPTGFVHQIVGRAIDGQGEAVDLLCQDLIRKYAVQIARGVAVVGRGMIREPADARHLVGVEGLDLAPGAGNRHRILQAQKIRAKAFQQLCFVPPALPGAGFPLFELALRHIQELADVADPKALPESVVAPFGHQVNLVAQVDQGGVDRGCRQHQDFGSDAVLDDFLQEPRVPAVLEFAFVVGVGPPVVAEVVGLVNDDEFEVGPVEIGQVNAVRHAGVAREIRMRQQRVAKAIGGEGIVALGVVDRIERPVLAQLFGAEHQDVLVLEFKVFDDGERGPGLAESDAVGQDAAALGFQAVDDADSAVLLEVVQGLPDLGVVEVNVGQLSFAVPPCLDVGQEQFIERLVIDEFRGVFLAEPVQDGEHVLLDVAGHVVVRPQAVEPFPEFGVGGLVRGRQVDFQIGPSAAAQPVAGEVGAADDGRPTTFGLGKVHLAVQKVGLADRADIDVMARYPLGARLGEVFLLEDTIGAETGFGQGE